MCDAPPLRTATRVFAWLSLATLPGLGCGNPFPSPGVLRDDRMLGLRVEVIEEGPLSVGLVPIPADRVRNTPLPLDTIVVRPLIAGPDGVRDPDDFAFTWLYCPQAACRPGQRHPADLQPCGEAEPTEGCRFGDGSPMPTLTLPAIDISPGTAPESILVQARPTVLAVAADRDRAELAHCESIFAGDVDDRVDAGGCVFGYVGMWMGPIGALLLAAPEWAASVGIDAATDPNIATALQPGFHPEIGGLPLTEHGSGNDPAWIARQGAVTPLPPRTEIDVGSPLDRRDNQTQVGVSVSEGGALSTFAGFESHTLGIHTPTDGLIERGTLTTGDVGDTFELIVTLSESASIAWATFAFEVAED